jgi:hypothetical protein
MVQVVAQLCNAHRLLAVANRDYYGHRLKAATLVYSALRGLGYRGRTTAVASSVAATAGASMAGTAPIHEAQSLSDTQLRQAQQILQAVMGQLNGSPCAAQVSTAIAEINIALSLN